MQAVLAAQHGGVWLQCNGICQHTVFPFTNAQFLTAGMIYQPVGQGNRRLREISTRCKPAVEDSSDGPAAVDVNMYELQYSRDNSWRIVRGYMMTEMVHDD